MRFEASGGRLHETASQPMRLPGLKIRIVDDESEGQIGWYIGNDKSTCVTLSREGDRVLLAIDFT